jgi:hypothetical protein
MFAGCDSGNESPPALASNSKASPTRTLRSGSTAEAPAPPPERVTTMAPQAISNLTAGNALVLRAGLRKNPARWNSALGPFYRAWATVDPEAALQAAATEGRTSVAAVTMALSGWASVDPDAAADWMKSQPESSHRDRHGAGLVLGWPADRMTDLADLVSDLAHSSPSTTLPVRLAARWLDEDPAAAAGWLGTMPAGTSTTRATDLLFRQWGSADPTAAGEFLANNTEVPNWDVAAAAYAKAVVPDDAETAALWAEAIQNPDLRGQIRAVLPLLRKPPDPQDPVLPGGP